MKFSQEFKEAIYQLPEKEKDKLILRLLKKDLKLANRLEFELLSDETVEEKREELAKFIKAEVQDKADTFYSLGYLKMEVRNLSGRINDFVFTTKDKIGEISLNILLLKEVLEQNETHILNASPGQAYKFSITVVSRIFKIMRLIKKQHEDLQIEFEEDLEELGLIIANNDLIMHTAIHHGLDVNWLITSGIPEEIETIYKELRSMGFLR